MASNDFAVVGGPAGNQVITPGQAPDATQRQQSGLHVDAVSTFWGGGEFVYGRASAGIRQFGLAVCTPSITGGAIRHNFAEVPNTANLTQSLYIAVTAMNEGDWGWFMQSGCLPVNCNASVTANTTFGIAAAGQGGANSAGKQVLGGRIALAATTTVAKANCTGLAGQNVITVPDAAGWFIGAYLSGTGVGSGAKITSISSDERSVVVDVNNSAAVTGTVTATYNNSTIYYNVAYIDRPNAQGAIT